MMSGNRLSGLVLVTVAWSAVAACEGRLERAPHDGAPATQASEDEASGDEFGGEADRTAAMEAHAEDARERFDAAMNDATSDDERQRAYEEFEAARLELNEMAESESTDEDETYPPPPMP